MVELIERNNIFAHYKIIASEVAKIQDSLFDHELYSDIEDDNDKKIYRAAFDALNYEKSQQNYDIKILTIEHNIIKTYSKVLCETISKLFNGIDVKEIFIISGLKVNFFNSLYNKYKPLTNAYKKLEAITNVKYYDEALCLKELSEEITDIIFWLTRCSPDMDNIIIFDKLERYYLNICKYGNIHFTGLNGKKISKEDLAKIGLRCIEGREYDQFSNDGAINGRRIYI
jgi:hypothetical protein